MTGAIELVERSLEVARGPQDQDGEHEPERSQLVLLALPVALAELAAVAVEEPPGQTVTGLLAVELGGEPRRGGSPTTWPSAKPRGQGASSSGGMQARSSPTSASARTWTRRPPASSSADGSCDGSGPQTVDHFQWWTGVEAKDAAITWGKLRRELVLMELAGESQMLLEADIDLMRSAEPLSGVRLIQNDDPWLKLDRTLHVADKSLHDVDVPPSGVEAGTIHH